MIEQPSPSPFPRPPDPIDRPPPDIKPVPPPDIPPPAGPPTFRAAEGPRFPQPILSLAGERHAQQRFGLPVRADELKAARQPGGRASARHRDRGMAGQVEELREPEHQVAHRFVGRRPSPMRRRWRRRNRQRRQHQRVVSGQRRVDLAPQHLAPSERAHVVLGQHVSTHLEPQTHRRRVALGHRLERRRVIRRRVARARWCRYDRRRSASRAGCRRPRRSLRPRAARSSASSNRARTSSSSSVAEVRARHGEPQAARPAGRHERPGRRVAAATRDSTSHASMTVRASGPT